MVVVFLELPSGDHMKVTYKALRVHVEEIGDFHKPKLVKENKWGDSLYGCTCYLLVLLFFVYPPT